MQKGGTVYILPRDADLGDSACDLDADFLPIRDIFKYFREDLDMLAQPRERALEETGGNGTQARWCGEI